MTSNMELTLGSGSPRRKEILTKAGFSFSIKTADVIESSDSSLGLEGLSITNARLKAEAVYHSAPHTSHLVIGSDTVVWLEGKAYGKPKSVAESVRMLTELSGKTHQVGTGVALTTSEGTEAYCEIAHVTFKALTRADIDAYISDIYVADKAGSYAIQDGGERIITSYDGEFEGIMGLPMKRLEHLLLSKGVKKDEKIVVTPTL